MSCLFHIFTHRMRYKLYECFASDLFPRQKWMSCQGHKQTPLGPSKIFLCTHTHTHTPCPPALQEAKHLWMWETPQMSSSWPHSWSDTLGWASQIAVWLGFFRQLPTSTYGLWDGTHSLPSQPLQGSPKCFPLKTPLSSSPPCPTLDETDYMLVPEAKVIFHSANSYSQQTQDGHRTSELDKTQASVLQFLSMEVVLMTMPASQSTVEKIKWDLAQSPVNSRC